MPCLSVLDCIESRGLSRRSPFDPTCRCSSSSFWLQAVGSATLDHFDPPCIEMRASCYTDAYFIGLERRMSLLYQLKAEDRCSSLMNDPPVNIYRARSLPIDQPVSTYPPAETLLGRGLCHSCVRRITGWNAIVAVPDLVDLQTGSSRYSRSCSPVRQLQAAIGSGPLRVAVGSEPLKAAVGSEPLKAAIGSEPLKAAVGSEPLKAAIDSKPLGAAVGLLSIVFSGSTAPSSHLLRAAQSSH